MQYRWGDRKVGSVCLYIKKTFIISELALYGEASFLKKELEKFAILIRERSSI